MDQIGHLKQNQEEDNYEDLAQLGKTLNDLGITGAMITKVHKASIFKTSRNLVKIKGFWYY